MLPTYICGAYFEKLLFIVREVVSSRMVCTSTAFPFLRSSIFTEVNGSLDNFADDEKVPVKAEGQYNQLFIPPNFKISSYNRKEYFMYDVYPHINTIISFHSYKDCLQ